MLSAQKATQRSRENRLVAEAAIGAAIGVLAAVAAELKTILELDGDATVDQPGALESLGVVLRSMLPYVLGIGQHFPVSCEEDALSLAFDAFFGRLANDTAIPIVRAFWPLSLQSYSTSLQKPKSSKKKCVVVPDATAYRDNRMKFLELLQPLFSIPKSATHMSIQCRRFAEVVYCCCVKELEGIFALRVEDSASDSTRAHVGKITLGYGDRVSRLARKDATWYLSSVAFSCLFVLQSGTRLNLDFIHLETDAMLSRILSVSVEECQIGLQSRHAHALSDIERGMLMTLLEHACIGTFQSSIIEATL